MTSMTPIQPARHDATSVSRRLYRPESFEALVERGGWRVKTVWTSDARSFGVFLLDTGAACSCRRASHHQ